MTRAAGWRILWSSSLRCRSSMDPSLARRRCWEGRRPGFRSFFGRCADRRRCLACFLGKWAAFRRLSCGIRFLSRRRRWRTFPRGPRPWRRWSCWHPSWTFHWLKDTPRSKKNQLPHFLRRRGTKVCICLWAYRGTSRMWWAETTSWRLPQRCSIRTFWCVFWGRRSTLDFHSILHSFSVRSWHVLTPPLGCYSGSATYSHGR